MSNDEGYHFPPVRRVVTGHDTEGRSVVLIDGEADNSRRNRPETRSTQVWSTDATPADISVGVGVEDLGARRLGSQPPANGTRCTVIDFAPGAGGSLHRTETLDYAIVVSGEIEMTLDDSTVPLQAGDIVVQRGTNHAWINRGLQPARIAFVLIDAEALGIGEAHR
jgi:quercetin dioxygenase-like cupin family protein